MEARERKSKDWWKLGDGFMLVTYAITVLWTLKYHEKWADEAQAWLLARDLGLGTIWLREARYEGSPGLWHTILWVAQHVFHAGYGVLGYIGAAFAIAGAAVLLFLAPFPRYLRWPLAFTYVMVYQYAVIARPYTILPLLAFCAAILYRDFRHPERMAIVLILLAVLTFHGSILAACLGLAYVVETIKRWSTVDKSTQIKYFVSGVAVACTFLFLFVTLKPTPDVEEMVVKHQLAQASPAAHALYPSITNKVTTVTSGAFLDWFLPSAVFLGLVGAWCVRRRKWLTFVLPVGVLIGFYSVVHGAAHHHGAVFVAAIAGLWIAWPTEEEWLAFDRIDQLGLMGVQGLLLVMCAVNIWDAAVVIQHEYRYPYSGAKDAAEYLKSVGADHGPMFGLLFGVVAVQAYFDHNVFVNNPTAYFHHGLPLPTTVLDVDLLNKVKPEYVVAYSMDPQLMVETGVEQLTSRGYELVHFSDGYYLYKRSVFEREVYFIFRRKVEADVALPSGIGRRQDSSSGEVRPD